MGLTLNFSIGVNLIAQITALGEMAMTREKNDPQQQRIQVAHTEPIEPVPVLGQTDPAAGARTRPAARNAAANR